MTRLAILVVLAGCYVGEAGAPPPQNEPDANLGSGGSDAAMGMDATALQCTDRGIAGAPHLHAEGGTPNTGQACMQAGCHAVGGLGPTWTAAGTVYKADGITPNPGAVVRVKMGAMTRSIVADQAGNFYTSLPTTFPAMVDVTACPDTVTMPGTAASGDCNSAGCHATDRIQFQ